MNRKRRASLRSAKALLTSAANIVERISDQESDSMDNVPENLQDSDRYEKMEQVSMYLEEALEHIESAIDCIGEATS